MCAKHILVKISQIHQGIILAVSCNSGNCYPTKGPIGRGLGPPLRRGKPQLSLESGCTTQPPGCTTFKLLATTTPLITFQLKIMTTFTQGTQPASDQNVALPHLSAAISMTISCRNDYVITEDTPPTNPQYVSHNDATVGWILPFYTARTTTA